MMLMHMKYSCLVAAKRDRYRHVRRQQPLYLHNTCTNCRAAEAVCKDPALETVYLVQLTIVGTQHCSAEMADWMDV
jgi:Pyruvate/2-oxoacid:ferredoxin oxidoreductase delta subunit